MRCSKCERTNDPEAVFCSYCGQVMAPSGGAPNTGPTVYLGQDAQPVVPGANSVAPAPQPMAPAGKPAKSAKKDDNWWIWLFVGVVALFILPRVLGLVLRSIWTFAGVGLLIWAVFEWRRTSSRLGAVGLAMAGFGMLSGMWWLVPIGFALGLFGK